MSWEKVATTERLQESGFVFKKAPRQIAIFAVREEYYAIDNRCPHEGYPLAQGIDRNIDETQWAVDDRQAFLQSARAAAMDHGFRDPIFSAHLVKTITAVQDELDGASKECGHYLLAGLKRFLSSPIKQKHVRRLARQAIELVGRDFK